MQCTTLALVGLVSFRFNSSADIQAYYEGFNVKNYIRHSTAEGALTCVNPKTKNT